MSEFHTIKEPTLSRQTRSKTARSPLSSRNTLALRHRPLATAITLALSLSVSTVQAANIWVDTASDGVTGQCRLRDAIIAANTDAVVEGCAAGSGADFIRLLNIAGSTITLGGTRLPTVTSEVTLQGESVTIDAAGNSGLLDVSGGSLSISRLSLDNGYANLVNDHSGGGIRVRNGASLALHESTISNSTAKSNGGAISIEDGGENVVITGSTLSNNSALGTVADTYGNGGGLFLAPVAGGVTLTLLNSTLSGNTASVTTGYGGGLYEYSKGSATINIANSTLFGNTAGKSGGGIWGNANLLNSIIANSTAISNPDTAACMGGLTGNAESISLIQGKGSCATSGGIFLDEDPRLGPLADNNGPAFTHAPIGTTNADSPVIDALNRPCFLQEKLPDNVIYTFDLSSDQRGYERIDEQCDLGAVEVAGAALQTGPDFVINSDIDEYTVLNKSGALRILTGDGHCNIAPGDCTVRDAVNAANVSADDSTITIAESLPRPIQITMAGVEPLLVTSNLTIQGADASLSTESADRVRYVTRHITLDSARLTIHDLSLFNGWARSGSGGAILARNEATLELVNSTLTSNEADVYGGAIDAGPGTEVTITGCTAELNRAGLQGGAINLGVGGTLTLTDSVLSENGIYPSCQRGSDTTPRCGGGGIFVQSGAAYLLNSSLSMNTAFGDLQGYGGGIYSVDSVVTMENSTLAGNLSRGIGGGLWVQDTDLTLTNSTLSGNSALTGGAIFSAGNSSVKLFNSTLFANGDPDSAAAGGIAVASSAVELSNSIIANSSGQDCSGSPSITTHGVNLVGDGGVDCGFTPGASLLSGDAMLGPLANNGGPTQTHLPQTGSPVIDVGDNATVPAGLLYDQRGNGYPRIISVNVDLGAVEWNEIIFANGFEGPGS